MKITKKDVENTAKLSRLEFDEEQKARIQEDMNSILGYMEILNQVDTSGISDLVRPEGEMRDDKVEPSVDPAQLLKNAPKKEGTSFVVPRVID